MLFSNNSTNHEPWYIFIGMFMNNSTYRDKQWWSVDNPYIYHCAIVLGLAKYIYYSAIVLELTKYSTFEAMY